MYDVINLTFSKIMVALADMIAVRQFLFSHFLIVYACSLQCATNIVNHNVTPIRVLCTLYYKATTQK